MRTVSFCIVCKGAQFHSAYSAKVPKYSVLQQLALAFKGSVQRKLRWVETGVNRWVWVSDRGTGQCFIVKVSLHLVYSFFPFPVRTTQFLSEFWNNKWSGISDLTPVLMVLLQNVLPQNVLPRNVQPQNVPPTKRPRLQNILPTKHPRLQNILVYKTSSSTKRPAFKRSSPTKRPHLQNVLVYKTSFP